MDKDLIIHRMVVALDNFKTAIQQHSDINKKRADGGWSVGEIADHIVKSTQTDLGETKKTDRPYDQLAASIRDLFLNFQLKFTAAPELQSDRKRYSVEELFSMLDRNRDNILKMIKNDDLTETFVDIQLPGWGALTKFEWLVLFESHIIRHTNQVIEFNKVTA